MNVEEGQRRTEVRLGKPGIGWTARRSESSSRGNLHPECVGRSWCVPRDSGLDTHRQDPRRLRVAAEGHGGHDVGLVVGVVPREPTFVLRPSARRVRKLHVALAGARPIRSRLTS